MLLLYVISYYILMLLTKLANPDALQQVVEEHRGRVHKARQEQRLKGGLF